MVVLRFLVWLILGSIMMLPHILEAASPPSIHHRLTLELDPETHRLTATDVLQLTQNLYHRPPLAFALNPNLTLDRVEIDGKSVAVSKAPTGSSEEQQLFTQWIIEYPLPKQKQSDSPPILTIVYHGPINDSPTASRGLRFVRPDKTNGHIGKEGIYLSSETFWYPTWEQHLVTFDLEVTLPSDWHPITQGKEIQQTVTQHNRISQWRIASPTEALTLAANTYVVQKKPWRNIQLATYLFPKEAPLAEQYLEATATYLELYTKLLGPYPFSQFAVAENFFPSGLGMPSFTLLGQRIVQRGYTQPYSLGHEIVHSWLGNSVFNDFVKGNWVEGLTTYLANYYYGEATGNQAAASKIRRRMMDEYNLYATQINDYPIRQFHHKETRVDNAVGYQKTALVFHMLRQEVGDDAFFQGVRRITQEGTGQFFEWQDLEQIFSQVAKRDLKEFFEQWVERPGAPLLDLTDLLIQPDSLRPGYSTVSGTVSQTNAAYTLPLPIQVNLEDESTFTSTLALDQAKNPFSLNLPSKPTSITLDPEHHWLLRQERQQLRPMLNAWDTATRRIVIQATSPSKEEQASFKALFRRLEGQSDIEIQHHNSPAITEEASYLIIGTAAHQLLGSQALPTCQEHVEVKSERVTIFEQAFEGPDVAFLITCPHPKFPKHTVSLFWGSSPKAVTPIARLLFFYGWDSYLVFEQGKVVARGMFQPVHSARVFPIPPP